MPSDRITDGAALTELVAAISMRDPLLPQPHWPQDVAFVAFVIARRNEQADRLDDLSRRAREARVEARVAAATKDRQR